MNNLRRWEEVAATIDFGVTLPLSDITAFARRAESLGYAYLTSGDHLAFHGPQANAFVALAIAAGATEHIKLLSSATLLPLYPAALAAKMTAMLDSASGGRFNLGVGIGGEYPPEFAATGVPVSQRASRTNEALDVIRRLLREDHVSYDGRYNSFSDISIQPRRPSPPPIWIAGRKDPAIRRAARYGDAWMPYMYTPQQLGQSMETLGCWLREEGRMPGEVRGALFAWTCVYPDAEKARRSAAEIVGAVYKQDFSRLVDRYLIAGDPATCRARLAEYATAGASAVMINLACPTEDMDLMLRLFAEDVMPEFQDQGGMDSYEG